MTLVKERLVEMVPEMPAMIPNLPEEEAQQVLNIFIKLDKRKDEVDVSKRIGVGKGRIVAPDDFDAGNEEIAAFLMESAL